MEKEPIGENISPQKSIETSKIKSQICETVLHILKGGIKNRITALSYIGLFTSQCLSNEINTFVDISALSCLGIGITLFGVRTEEIYKRTKNYIGLHGKLDERFFIKIIEHYNKDYLLGYCEQQGIYLAAKEFGLEEEFFELKKKHTKNIVPNF